MVLFHYCSKKGGGRYLSVSFCWSVLCKTTCVCVFTFWCVTNGNTVLSTLGFWRLAIRNEPQRQWNLSFICLWTTNEEEAWQTFAPTWSMDFFQPISCQLVRWMLSTKIQTRNVNVCTAVLSPSKVLTTATKWILFELNWAVLVNYSVVKQSISES